MIRENSTTIVSALVSLWGKFSKRRRYQFVALIILAFMVSFAELVTIGAVIPLMAVLIAPDQLFQSSKAQYISNIFDLKSPSEMVLPICVAFGFMGVASALIRLLQIHANSKFAFGIGAELSVEMYRRTLYQPYERIIDSNSSDLINGITNKAAWLINNIIISSLNIVSGLVVMSVVLSGLIWVEPRATLLALGTLGGCYVLISAYSKKSLQRLNGILSYESGAVIRILQEGLGGIRDVLIGNNQEVYANAYRRADASLRSAQSYAVFITQSPRYIIEGVAILLVSIAIYVTFSNAGGYSVFPVLAALVLGAQRMLPLMQQIYNAVSSIRIHKFALVDSIDALNKPIPDFRSTEIKPVSFEKTIELKQVCFSYRGNGVPVLNEVNLVIHKGQKIGVIGSTGSGKSTFLDILMGLLTPTSGRLLVDGVPITDATQMSWQAHLSHVPQSIFLVDGTIAENIALAYPGKPISLDQVRKCAQLAHISETIDRFPDKFETRVGERGIMLSGGQRQRIGIARALYKAAQVLILDEATSALDIKTEQLVMDSIEAGWQGLTFFIVAHRVTTLKRCDLIIDISGGTIQRVGSFDEFFESSRT